MIVVAFGQCSLDLEWVPPSTPIIVVHNDDLLADSACVHPRVLHLRPGTNLGFGRGVNLALCQVTSPRVVICNPDMELKRAHFRALTIECEGDLVTVPLVRAAGQPMASVVPYPTAPLLVMGTFRVIRVAPPGSRRRAWLTRLLGRWGEERRWSVTTPIGRYSLQRFWVPGAAFSIDTDLLRAVGGFDERYFLYLEDTDLCRRLAARDSGLGVIVAEVVPGFHEVGGSARTSDATLLVRRSQWKSAVLYASRQTGVGWRVAEVVLRLGAIVSLASNYIGRMTAHRRSGPTPIT